MTTSRRARHERLSAFLASRSDDDLASRVDTREVVGVGGGSSVIDVEGEPVFVKRIPLTDEELARPHSTANLFDLPVFCQYGIGGPSFNAWRELAANRVATDAGATAPVPLLHHWRVLPGRAPVAAEHADVDATAALMGGSAAVRVRLEALAAASHSLVLFSEYIAHPVEGWLAEDPEAKADVVERELAGIVGFLRDHDLLHLDGHFGNLRTDGERLYLTDFGLATSPSFDLSAAERDFVRRHAGHDADYAAMRLVNWLVTAVCGVAVPPDGIPTARNAYVRRCAAGDIPDDVPPGVAAILARHAPAAARMNGFYWRLFDGDVHAEFPVADHGERMPRR
ncbi:serine/threonine protein phosphatase [Saccharothrix sp. S26]|uniref:serine/threonine protein phosphatase n=1 Tax=Saccharothrix sp. S26 TaxID=2907215 RepID=UPI001F2A15A6|nr:serine/threonine protein phosphatase [Saccharothrix sp. S26]MCE6997161.1 serine/threonine protein phosphatase [Saccharothrix sp. S26]